MTSLHDPQAVALESELASLAAEAVSKLAIGDAIKRLGATLYQQIEECDAFAAASTDGLFFSTALPIANALIHYASSQYSLTDARKWAAARWPEEHDPTSMLAALTLIYVVEQGMKAIGHEPERKKAWQRIHRRIETILQREPHEAAVA